MKNILNNFSFLQFLFSGSKHAIHGYFDALRREKQETGKLAVTLLCPGPTLTNFLAESFTGW